MPADVPQSVLRSLIGARTEYEATVSPFYDEVLRKVSSRILANDSVGKEDIGALAFWKRIRVHPGSAAKLHAMSDTEVRRVTAGAVEVSRDSDLTISESAQRGRALLAELPLFVSGDALASAVLFASAPTRMAVYDRRADAGVTKLLGVEIGSAPRRYMRYMKQVERLTEAVNATEPDAIWRPRDVDLALYMLGV